MNKMQRSFAIYSFTFVMCRNLKNQILCIEFFLEICDGQKILKKILKIPFSGLHQ